MGRGKRKEEKWEDEKEKREKSIFSEFVMVSPSFLHGLTGSDSSLRPGNLDPRLSVKRMHLRRRKSL